MIDASLRIKYSFEMSRSAFANNLLSASHMLILPHSAICMTIKNFH
ncbi:hypothetical protein HanPSC8_Chr06g0244201 [Helianthus annuus]|nr:hypothetical protein HanPSC8_Chr06g0244201 [Helianthus annuus]